LYALQQVIVMFPATIAVALLTGFHVSTTIFASGLATLCFILVTGKKLPLYYGSSFSYLPAIIGLMGSEALSGYSLNEKIAVAQFGIVMSGLVSIAAGLIVNRFGKDSINKILPATITGPIAMAIGLTLAANALMDATAIPEVAESATTLAGNMAWVISLTTLFATILFSVYSQGLLEPAPLAVGPRRRLHRCLHHPADNGHRFL
jgi:uracil permease